MIIGLQTKFDASHHLPKHKGKCANMHGHTWYVDIQLKGFMKADTCMVMDFCDFKAAAKDIIDQLDHKVLNTCGPAFTNPTCEVVASWIKAKLVKKGFAVHAVRVSEGGDGYIIVGGNES